MGEEERRCAHGGRRTEGKNGDALMGEEERKERTKRCAHGGRRTEGKNEDALIGEEKTDRGRRRNHPSPQRRQLMRVWGEKNRTENRRKKRSRPQPSSPGPLCRLLRPAWIIQWACCSFYRREKRSMPKTQTTWLTFNTHMIIRWTYSETPNPQGRKKKYIYILLLGGILQQAAIPVLYHFGTQIRIKDQT